MHPSAVVVALLSVKCVGILSLYSGYLCFCCLPVIRIMEINEVFFFQFRKLHTVISKKSSKNKGSSLHVAHFKVNIITCAKRCADVPQQLKPFSEFHIGDRKLNRQTVTNARLMIEKSV